MSVIEAKGLCKKYGDNKALDEFDLTVAPGRIVGLIGPNGSGKTTAMKAILGLNELDSGTLSVLSKDPAKSRAELMREVAFIADTGILPRWMRVCDLLEYVEGVHPSFDRQLAEARLAKTEINPNKRIRVLSKGMHVQLHLALVLAIDAKLLVLDEPTLGLDIIYRQQFYDAILSDYFDNTRSILVTTHEVREIEHILTDVVFVHRGRVMLAESMERIGQQFLKLTSANNVGIPTGAIASKQTLNGLESIYSGVSMDQLESSGEVSVPNLAELFVAIIGGDS